MTVPFYSILRVRQTCCNSGITQYIKRIQQEPNIHNTHVTNKLSTYLQYICLKRRRKKRKIYTQHPNFLPFSLLFFLLSPFLCWLSYHIAPKMIMFRCWLSLETIIPSIMLFSSIVYLCWCLNLFVDPLFLFRNFSSYFF